MIKNLLFGFFILLHSSTTLLAQGDADEVKKLRRELKETRNEQERFRYLAVAEAIAVRSTEINDKELAALLAVQAYNFNVRYHGYERSSNVYAGLCNALRNYGKLPIKIDSNIQALNERGKKKITIDDLGSERLRRFLKKQILPIKEINFSHSGQLLATTGDDKTIRIWNLNNIVERPMMILEYDSIHGIAFSSDDSQIVCRLINSRTGDLSVHVWSLKMDKMANQLCSLLTHNLFLEDWKQFVGSDVFYESTCKDIPPLKKN